MCTSNKRKKKLTIWESSLWKGSALCDMVVDLVGEGAVVGGVKSHWEAAVYMAVLAAKFDRDHGQA